MYHADCGTSHARVQPCPPSTAFTSPCACGQWHLASEYDPCACGQHGPNLYSCPPCVTSRVIVRPIRRYSAR